MEAGIDQIDLLRGNCDAQRPRSVFLILAGGPALSQAVRPLAALTGKEKARRTQTFAHRGVKSSQEGPRVPEICLTSRTVDAMLVELSKSERGARMLEKLRNSDKVVGTRRLLRAVLAGEIAEVYLAADADLFIVRQVREACNRANVRIVEVDSMKQLGEACGVDVRTASAGIRK